MLGLLAGSICDEGRSSVQPLQDYRPVPIRRPGRQLRLNPAMPCPDQHQIDVNFFHPYSCPSIAEPAAIFLFYPVEELLPPHLHASSMAHRGQKHNISQFVYVRCSPANPTGS